MLFPFYIESIEIPYKEGVTLPGYFYHYSKKDSFYNNGDRNTRGKEIEKKLSGPTLIAHGGFDSTLEELYSSAAAPALERGYNCLTFEGPGQGGVIRKQGIPFRHDWEKVVTPVIDYAINRKEEFGIDVNLIALMGMSMGGYLAARAQLLTIAFLHVYLMMEFMMDMPLLHHHFLSPYQLHWKKVIRNLLIQQ